MSKIKQLIGEIKKNNLTKQEILAIICMLDEDNYSEKDILKIIPNHYLSDKDFFLELIAIRNEIVDGFKDNVFFELQDYELINLLKITSFDSLGKFPKKFREERILTKKNIVEELINSRLELFEYASDELKNNKQMVFRFFEKFKMIRMVNINIMKCIGNDLLKDSETMLSLINNNPYLLKDKVFMNNISIDIEIIGKNFVLLRDELKQYFFNIVDESKITKEMYLDYLENTDKDIYSKKPMFQDDISIIQKAAESVLNFKSFTKEQQSDLNILYFAIQNKEMFQYINKKTYENEDFIKMIVNKRVDLYWDYIPVKFKNDNELLMRIFSYNNFDEKYKKDMNESIFNNKYFADLIMSQNPKNYKSVSKEIQQDEEVAKKLLIDSDGKALEFLDEKFRKDLDFNLWVLKKSNVEISKEYWDEEILKNKTFVIEAIKHSEKYAEFYLKWIDKDIIDIKENSEIMLGIKSKLYAYAKNGNVRFDEDYLSQLYREVHTNILSEKLTHVEKEAISVRNKKKI